MKKYAGPFLFVLSSAFLAALYLTPAGQSVLRNLFKPKVVYVDGQGNVIPDAEVDHESLTHIEAQPEAELAEVSVAEVEPAVEVESAPMVAETEPAPMVEAEAVIPEEPVVAETVPAPAPEGPKAPSTFAEILRQPKLWPASVILNKDQEFAVMVEGQVFGTAEVKAGTPVKVLTISENGVRVDFNGVQKQLPVSETDLLRQFGIQEELANVDTAGASQLN